MVGSRTCEATMTEERFQQIERLVEAGGRYFDPVTGLFEPTLLTL